MTFDEFISAKERAGEKSAAADAARDLGVTPQCIGNWRRGSRTPRPKYVNEIMTWSGGAVTPESWFKASGVAA